MTGDQPCPKNYEQRNDRHHVAHKLGQEEAGRAEVKNHPREENPLAGTGTAPEGADQDPGQPGKGQQSQWPAHPPLDLLLDEIQISRRSAILAGERQVGHAGDHIPLFFDHRPPEILEIQEDEGGSDGKHDEGNHPGDGQVAQGKATDSLAFFRSRSRHRQDNGDQRRRHDR